MTLARKARAFWPLLIIAFAADCTSKHAVVESLETPGTSLEILGDLVRFTLVYNQGAAMGLLGPWAKEFLGLLSLVAVVIFFRWYWKAPPDATVLGAATALVIAGALGNGWQRLLASPGVVDFIDVGIGTSRFWVFNIADVSLHLGAALLVVVLVRESRQGATSDAGRNGRMGTEH